MGSSTLLLISRLNEQIQTRDIREKIEMYHSVLSGGDLGAIFQQKLNEAKFTIAHQHLQKPSDYGAVLPSITIRISLCHFS